MLKLSDLALRPDMELGPMLVSPSRRLVEGPGGQVHLEPLIMQVFLLLLDGRGKVVTRNELFDRCWGGVIVGDDSLNRAIAKVRRTGTEVAPGLFEVETIPRTGYRLTGGILEFLGDGSGPAYVATPAVSRRAIVGSAAGLAVVAAAGFGLWSVRSREDERFQELMDRGRKALDYGHPSSNAAAYFQRAVAMRPDNADAQGRLALSLSFAADFGDPSKAAAAAERADTAARAALALDPNEPNARTAQLSLQRSMLDLVTAEDRIRQILATDRDNIFAMHILWGLLQSVGRSHEAFALIERAMTIEPLAAGNNFPRAQLLWILGRTAEADRVIDRAMQYWPAHPWVRAARFSIFAYTGRPRAALAMLDDEKTRPQEFTPAGIALWRVCLRALEERSAASIALARTACLDAAKQEPKLAVPALLILSALGEVDAAFDVANDLMVFRRPITPPPDEKSSQHRPVRSTAWLFSPWLFTPPCASIRRDPRFKSLCDGIGLTEYWHKRGIGPDAFLFER